MRGKDAEHRAAASVKERKGLSWHAWSKVLAEYIDVIDGLLSPDLVIIGGGVSKDADRFIHELPSASGACRPRCRTAPASSARPCSRPRRRS